MRAATDGWDAVFNASTIRDLRLDALPGDLRRKQEDEIAAGHCNLLPREMLFPRARAQIARDIVMARTLRPYAERGVVLLAGNGHVRRDIGVPAWLPRRIAGEAISIGILESGDDGSMPASAADYDGMASGPSNLGPTNETLIADARSRAAAYRRENGLAADALVPIDATTASGSGLDPHISPANARLQGPRVAHVRGLPLNRVLALVEEHTASRSLGFLGEPGVNVLELNLALDGEQR